MTAGLLDEIAFALDSQSLISVANWSNLSRKLHVPFKVLWQFHHQSSRLWRPDVITYKLFEYLSDTFPQMTLKPLKEALEVMKRLDVLKILQDQNLRGKLNGQRLTGTFFIYFKYESLRHYKVFQIFNLKNMSNHEKI